MTQPCHCFFAYSSKPLSISETLESAIDEINRRGSGILEVQGWKSLAIGGKFIIDTICQAIDHCDLFVCDLTTVNPNVLFELGYAITKNKRIWITLDASFREAQTKYERLRLLTTIGYTSYQNHFHLVDRFFEEKPYQDVTETVYQGVFRTLSPRPLQGLLYLKCELDTEASRHLTIRLDKSLIPVITDDPQEVNSRPLAWYAQNIRDAYGVIAHFLDENRGDASKHLQNAKYSFVTGMAHGFGKPLLMLAHDPFVSPIDYRDLLYVHDTAKSCIREAERWMDTIENNYSAKRSEHRQAADDIRAAAALQSINLGEDIAENEQRDLLDYFVVTDAYNQAFRMTQSPQSVIYVGRKGSGKTANLFKLAGDLERDPKNHVCVVKPVSYELEGVIEVLRSSIHRSEHGYLIESLWKFLIYTELIQSVYERIVSKPVHYVRSQEEEDLVTFVDQNAELTKSSFTIRLENAIRGLCQISPSGSLSDQRAKVSEILHSRVLGDLRGVLGRVLKGRSRVCVLIDNLDKAWVRGGDLSLLSDFIFGLLNVSRIISDEFRKQGSTWQQVNLSLMIFLRSDIFSFIMSEARERDKLTFRRLDWDDKSLLLRIIEERWRNSLGSDVAPDEIWKGFFVSAVMGIPTTEYLVNRIIPRPRDMIYLCRTSLSNAVNRKHSRIEESDIIDAEKDYSNYALNSLEAETSTQLDRFEELLYEFAGENEIVTRARVEDLIQKAQIPSEKSNLAVDLLCESSFLGLEIDDNKFEFLYHDENRKKVVQSLARRTTERLGTERFLINVPFRAYLEVKPEPERY